MDCVTTRLQMEIGVVFLSLTLRNARKLAKFFLVVREPRIFFRENDFKKVVRNSEIFPRKCRIFLVVRELEKVENRWSLWEAIIKKTVIRLCLVLIC